jgi:hypothetical protein
VGAEAISSAAAIIHRFILFLYVVDVGHDTGKGRDSQRIVWSEVAQIVHQGFGDFVQNIVFKF